MPRLGDDAPWTRDEKDRVIKATEFVERKIENQKENRALATLIATIILAVMALKAGLGDTWSWIKAMLTGAVK